MPSAVKVELLARRRDTLPTFAALFREEWPRWYGEGGPGNAEADLAAFAASETELPVGVVATLDGSPVGVGALKVESLASHKHLTPWAAAGFVLPSHRGRGIGAALLEALVRHAGHLGYPFVYCGTATSVSLLCRSGWSELERINHEGEPLVIFRKAAA